MAKPSPELIEHIRNAAKKIDSSNIYQWGHMGACNCGFLAQEITKISKADIHSRAMQKYGDWNEQVDDYCPSSGLPMDELICELLNAGLDSDDLKELEKLSNKKVLLRMPFERRYLLPNRKEDVVLYMNQWADLLEDLMIEKVNLYQLKLKNNHSKSSKVLV